LNRVVVTGLGCITPIGNNVADFRTSLFAGSTGIAPFPPYPEAPGETQGLRFNQSAAVKDFDPRQHLDSGIVVSTDRTAQFAIVAARQAAQDSQLTSHHAPDRIAVIVGCACGGRQAEETETAKLYTRDARVHPLTVVRTMASAGVSSISIDLHITGPTLNISTACSSSTHAIGLAFQMIRSGMVDAAITGGHEAPLTFGFLRAWDSMRVVSPTQCRPFSADRDGMTIGEGAAMLTLESLESARARNAHIYAEIVGAGSSADASHITQPHAEGAASAIRSALKDADATPDEVGYISAHGTGTRPTTPPKPPPSTRSSALALHTSPSAPPRVSTATPSEPAVPSKPSPPSSPFRKAASLPTLALPKSILPSSSTSSLNPLAPQPRRSSSQTPWPSAASTPSWPCAPSNPNG
jgi:nodulation protein E